MNFRAIANLAVHGAIFILMACSLSHEAFSTEVSIKPVIFFEKKPSHNDNIRSSLEYYDDSIQVLGNDAAAISALDNKYAVRIIGGTDNKECSGDECKKLSLRRADMIYAWLIANGVSRSKLLPPEGRGSNSPIESNELSSGRERNRHVEFLVVPAARFP